MLSIITGGSGSGKSVYAETLACDIAKKQNLKQYYIATMRSIDSETDKRIARHVEQRFDKNFITIECPVNLCDLEIPDQNSIALVDCMSNLIANESYENLLNNCKLSTDELIQKITLDFQVLQYKCAHVIVVSNDVGHEDGAYSPETLDYIKIMNKVSCNLVKDAALAVEVVAGIPIVHKNTNPESGCGGASGGVSANDDEGANVGASTSYKINKTSHATNNASNIFRQLAVMLSMFTCIPMPQFKWNDADYKNMFLTLPLVGLIIGVALTAWVLLQGVLPLSPHVLACGSTLLPIIITGGFHLDGYCDTRDALSSHAPRSKKLEILGDPHIGAFGVFSAILYIAVLFMLWDQIFYIGTINSATQAITLAATMCYPFVTSRIIAGIASCVIAPAKKSGLGHSFINAGANKKKLAALIAMQCLASVLFAIMSPVHALVMAFAALITFACWTRLAVKNFGGVTGDLSGFLLSKIELYMIAALAICMMIERLI